MKIKWIKRVRERVEGFSNIDGTLYPSYYVRIYRRTLFGWKLIRYYYNVYTVFTMMGEHTMKIVNRMYVVSTMLDEKTCKYQS